MLCARQAGRQTDTNWTMAHAHAERVRHACCNTTLTSRCDPNLPNVQDKPSSRVLAPPGGGSSIQLGNYGGPSAGASSSAYGSPMPSGGQFTGGSAYGSYGSSGPSSGNPLQTAYAYGSTPDRLASVGVVNNNYSRPSGQQNVGNFITVSYVASPGARRRFRQPGRSKSLAGCKGLFVAQTYDLAG